MYMQRKAPFIIAISIAISIISWGGFFAYTHMTKKAQAQLLGPFLPDFGGLILAVDECTCSGSFLITIGPPVPAIVLYVPGVSMPHEWFQILRVGPWAKGTYRPGGVCLMAGKSCTPFSLQPVGTIFEVGTSL